MDKLLFVKKGKRVAAGRLGCKHNIIQAISIGLGYLLYMKKAT